MFYAFEQRFICPLLCREVTEMSTLQITSLTTRVQRGLSRVRGDGPVVVPPTAVSPIKRQCTMREFGMVFVFMRRRLCRRQLLRTRYNIELYKYLI